ncbi:ABC-2 transporter permease [Peribacillus alkalitolerans]|uniref:ABC-2 transporter permease n=1 Tax=Peribacillus alkalitolerans TaxID=1550385 RepID=UPI0013D2DBDE|nr:ABC-2 transporter permease [Peribacillus alkalitolerans]
MKQLFTLVQKEWLEMVRNYRIIWVPITFILIGLTDPITTYFLPDILKSAGGLPEGAVVSIPTPAAPEVFFMSLNQYNLLGILVIVLLNMGSVSNERKSGVISMILVKPVSYVNFISSKWIASIILIIPSIILGSLSSWYYTSILFGKIPFEEFINSVLIYSVWILFVISILLFLNSFLSSSMMIGFISVVIIMIINLIGGLLSKRMAWSPGQLSSYVGEYLVSGQFSEYLIGSLALTLLLTFICFLASVFLFRRSIAE